jgi:hypothetical protein
MRVLEGNIEGMVIEINDKRNALVRFVDPLAQPLLDGISETRTFIKTLLKEDKHDEFKKLLVGFTASTKLVQSEQPVEQPLQSTSKLVIHN